MIELGWENNHFPPSSGRGGRATGYTPDVHSLGRYEDQTREAPTRAQRVPQQRRFTEQAEIDAYLGRPEDNDPTAHWGRSERASQRRSVRIRPLLSLIASVIR